MHPPLIVSLKFDAATQEFFDALRQKYFPPERNHLAAHLTLFHHLPGAESGKIREDLRRTCAAAVAIPLAFPGWRSLGRGVAATVEAAPLIELRARLAVLWDNRLTPQDRQKFRPHVTVQNKVAPDEARRLLEKLSGEPAPLEGIGRGLLLWEYLGGPWKLEEEFPFGD